jgi:hypothetical protein
MNENFLITALGGSGTKFLSSVMNRSNRWTVGHEGLTDSEESKKAWKDALKSKTHYTPVHYDLNRVQEDLDSRGDYYGEVNARLRCGMHILNVKRKAIILRNPRHTFLSWYELFNGQLKDHYYGKLRKSLMIFDEFIQSGGEVIDFDKMVGDPQYLLGILHSFGIYDVAITNNIMENKINEHRTYKYKSFEDIPFKDRGYFNGEANWFINKYF